MRLEKYIALTLLLPLAGCSSLQSIQNAHGPASERIASLSWLMTITFLTVTVIMWVLLAVAAKRQRGSLDEHMPIDIGGGQAWIAIGGLAIPLLILTVFFVLGLQLLADFPIHGKRGGMHGDMSGAMSANAPKPDIRIIGHQWWWEVQYLDGPLEGQFTTANEIRIPTGRAINIELETADVMHSFWVPALHGKVDLIPGHPNFLRVEASQPGDYQGQCAEFCGAQHAHMRILVVAEKPAIYEAWLQAQRKPGAEPTTQQAILGEQLFLAGPCAMCHQVRGTLAGGRVAPDLTHIGSRQYLASNSFPNNDAYLEAWVTHAQSLKPDAKMPNLTQFDGLQLRSLVAYLRQLQ
jgi:cytochrome c oxidase subunit 2